MEGPELGALAVNEDWQHGLYSQHGGVCDDEPHTDLVERSLRGQRLSEQVASPLATKTLELRPTGL